MVESDILVVEDDDAVRLLLIDVLKERSTSVDGARDGVDALHHVSTRKYALVILDMMMPHMTGIDFLDSLEAMMSDPSIRGMPALPPVIVITAASAEQIPSSALTHRFPSMVRHVLRKPVDVNELARCVETVLGSH